LPWYADSASAQQLDGVRDGSGEARVYMRHTVSSERNQVVAGETWSMVGIVSQYTVRPRFE